jgi:hypothetical protein
MAANTYHLTAGLPVAKDSGQSPASGVNTFYLSAGLPPEPVAAPTFNPAWAARCNNLIGAGI